MSTEGSDAAALTLCDV